MAYEYLWRKPISVMIGIFMRGDSLKTIFRRVGDGDSLTARRRRNHQRIRSPFLRKPHLYPSRCAVWGLIMTAKTRKLGPSALPEDV
jgi:hypothetical protein